MIDAIVFVAIVVNAVSIVLDVMIVNINIDYSVVFIIIVVVDFIVACVVCVWLICRICLLYTSPSPRDKRQSRMPSSA